MVPMQALCVLLGRCPSQGSPVPSIKFQIAPRFRLFIEGCPAFTYHNFPPAIVYNMAMQQVFEAEAALAHFIVGCAGGKCQHMVQRVNCTFSILSFQIMQKAGFWHHLALPVSAHTRTLPANLAFRLSVQLNGFHETNYVIGGHTNAHFLIS